MNKIESQLTQPLSPQGDSKKALRTKTLSPLSLSISAGASSVSSDPNQAPSVYDFTDYREYLKCFFDFKKLTNPAYSASLFARKAGLGSNSRGYLKLVIENKRNLSAQTIRSFSEALGLNAQESLYFENLVLFNQSDRNQDKKYYFERLMASNKGGRSEQLELMKSQYAYVTNWYYVAIREMVAIKGFKEDPTWIASQLRGKIKKEEVAQAIKDLLTLGLLLRDPTTLELKQSEPLVKIAGGVFDAYLQNFHLQMIERSKESLLDDEYETRQASGVTLSCAVDRLPEIKKVIAKFRDELTEKFGVDILSPDSVVQISIQMFQLTQPKKPKAVEVKK
jgi:uncharacterized protein (TIGR02147 family)